MSGQEQQLGIWMQAQCPWVDFVLLRGLVCDSKLWNDRTVDLNIYAKERPFGDDYDKLLGYAETLAPNTQWNIGILNSKDPAYRFEALKGQLLFARDMESYLRFFSLTCREYESQMASYERQRRYRLEAMQQG